MYAIYVIYYFFMLSIKVKCIKSSTLNYDVNKLTHRQHSSYFKAQDNSNKIWFYANKKQNGQQQQFLLLE